MDPSSASRRALLAAGIGTALFAAARPARASLAPSEVAAELPAARLQGSARFRFFGLSVYDARLWVGERAVDDDWNVPLALEIEYLRSFEGEKIADRSLDEMRRQGEIAPALAERWRREMTRIFPDVRERDRITGVKRPGEVARFFVNGSLRGEVRDGEFARRFFGIWLSPQTSEPALRRALLSGGRS
jgi:hypothetical protein